MVNIIEIKINVDLINNKDLLNGLFFDCHCALYMVDLTSEKSFKNLQKLASTLENIETLNNNSNYLTNILILNKTDLKSEIEVNQDIIKNFLSKYPSFDSIEISLKEQEGLSELTSKIYQSYKKSEEAKFPCDKIRIYDNNIAPSQTYEFTRIDAKGTISCILVGDSETGKSSFLVRFYSNEFSDVFLTTIGIDKQSKIVKVMKDDIRLVLWDTAGQERFKSLPGKYYQNADGILILFDVNKKSSFENVKNWMADIKNNIGENHKTNVFLIGNKVDLKREVSKEEGTQMAKELGIKYFECSNKYNLNVNEIMCHMILYCYENAKNTKFKGKGTSLENANKKNRKRLC